MRKILLIIAGAILLLGLASYCASTQVPDIANNQTLALLKEAGFNQATLPEPQIRFAAMRYDRINLDPDGLSTIKRIEIHYNPLSVLLFRGLSAPQPPPAQPGSAARRVLVYRVLRNSSYFLPQK